MLKLIGHIRTTTLIVALVMQLLIRLAVCAASLHQGMPKKT